MNKTVLCILGQKQNSYKDPFLVYSDLFEIKYINNLPTLVELLKGKSLYYYNEELKSKNRFKCKLIKLLHKRFDNEAIFKTFFKYNKSDFETLILVHSPYIKPWIETHYPKILVIKYVGTICQ